MEDLFNPDKILVLGNKGTGKSYIYRSLREKSIVNALQKRANKTSLNCLLNDMIYIDQINIKCKTVLLNSTAFRSFFRNNCMYLENYLDM